MFCSQLYSGTAFSVRALRAEARDGASSAWCTDQIKGTVRGQPHRPRTPVDGTDQRPARHSGRKRAGHPGRGPNRVRTLRATHFACTAAPPTLPVPAAPPMLPVPLPAPFLCPLRRRLCPMPSTLLPSCPTRRSPIPHCLRAPRRFVASRIALLVRAKTCRKSAVNANATRDSDSRVSHHELLPVFPARDAIVTVFHQPPRAARELAPRETALLIDQPARHCPGIAVSPLRSNARMRMSSAS